MKKNLYVGNLNFRLSEENLRSAFAQFGDVTSVKIITDKETGRSRGFAFVEFENEEDAEKALEEMNGKSLEDRELKISFAKEKEKSDFGSRGPRQGGGGYRGGNDRDSGGGGFRCGNDRDSVGGGFRGGNDKGNRQRFNRNDE